MNQPTQAFEHLMRSDYGNIAGIVVRQGGQTLYEQYCNACTAKTPVHVFSVTKSVISLLIGIAIDKGFIAGVHQPVLDFFPAYTPKRGEKTLRQVTLQNLLTMTAPYKYRSAPYTKYFASDNWVKAALDLLGGRGPVGQFRYTPLIGPDILSGILAAATGRPVLDFATQHLFTPLGIAKPANVIFATKEEQFAFLKEKHTSAQWVADPQGTNTAGWGLTLTAADMANIGQLVLDGGAFGGRQVVSSAWVAESTAAHSRWPELGLPYGYLWWAGVGDGYAAMGDSGNVIYVNPQKKMVAAIASLYKPSAKDRIAFIQQHLEPMLDNRL